MDGPGGCACSGGSDGRGMASELLGGVVLIAAGIAIAGGIPFSAAASLTA